MDGAVPAGGTNIFYRSVGEGTPIMIVHGGPGLGHAYLTPLESLADRFRVIFYDQRGAGASEAGDPDRISIAGGIDDLEAVLDGLGIERANLLGHSWGANLSALFASRRPDRMASLVVANPGPPLHPEHQMLFGAEFQRRSAAHADEIQRLRTSDDFGARQPAALEEYTRVLYRPFFDDPAVGDALSYGFTEITAANYMETDERTFRDLDPTEAISGLERVACPTLVLWATHDPLPQVNARLFAERIPGSRYERLEGANHFAYLEAPDTFYGVVRPFLEQHAR